MSMMNIQMYLMNNDRAEAQATGSKAPSDTSRLPVEASTQWY